MEDCTSNCSQSVKNSWFVPISTLVPMENAKSLPSFFKGTAKISRDRDT